MILLLTFMSLTILAIAALLRIVFIAIYRLFSRKNKKSDSKRKIRLKKTAVFFLAVMILNIGLVTVSQFTASTPTIADENGKVPENSISELIRLELNDTKQWITIRGLDQSKPVLLFLAGGPGGSQMAAVRYELPELEKHFVVVNWDQPGAAKSYSAEKSKNIDAETYIEDGYALTEYLKKRFSKEKIYLVGESWGSALAIFMADRYPDSYHAIIGTGQMVDFAETEQLNYEKAMQIAAQKGDTEIISRLEKNGLPPYYGKDVTWKSAVYLNYISSYMAHNPQITNPGYNTIRDIASAEYGLLDKINYIRGIAFTFNNVYQKLYDIDLRDDFSSLDVPVYFFIGRHDLNAPTELSEEYFDVLEAPQKKLVWFEHSGHSPWINEKNKFAEEVISCFLDKQTKK